MVSGFETGESLGSRTKTDDPGAWSSPHLVQYSFLCLNSNSECTGPPFTSGRCSRYKRSCLLGACLA